MMESAFSQSDLRQFRSSGKRLLVRLWAAIFLFIFIYVFSEQQEIGMVEMICLATLLYAILAQPILYLLDYFVKVKITVTEECKTSRPADGDVSGAPLRLKIGSRANICLDSFQGVAFRAIFTDDPEIFTICFSKYSKVILSVEKV